jgi:hypothetical protein
LTSIGGAIALFETAENADYYSHSLNVPKPYLFRQLKRLALETASGEHYGLKTFVHACAARRALIRPARWCAKTFPTKNVADALQLLYPDVRFVYIVRNGLEVVQSMTKYVGFREREFEAHCQAWAKSMRTYGYLLDYPTAVSLRHEELRTDPEGVFGRIWPMLDLRPDRGVVEFVKTTVVHPLDRRTASRTSATVEFAKRSVPYETWNDQQRMMFVEICGEEMGKAGYQIPYIL